MPTTMRAITQQRYGPPEVLELTTVDVPTPGPDEVLIEVSAASVNPLDWHMSTGRPWLVRSMAGFRRPKKPVLGTDVAGVVRRIGADVTEFAVGDTVFGGASGAFAEWTTARPRALARIPGELAVADAAALPIAGATAHQALVTHAAVAPGERVLINGAAGGVGTLAVQIAKARGAHVTGVCSTKNVDMVAGLGADEVIDYTAEDFVAHGGGYDVILDNVGNRAAADLLAVLADDGIVVVVSGPKSNPLLGPLVDGFKKKLRFMLARRRLVQFTARLDAATMEALADLAATGRLRPTIDKTITLEQIPAAIAEIGTGHARAKIVVDVPSRAADSVATATTADSDGVATTTIARSHPEQ